MPRIGFWFALLAIRVRIQRDDLEAFMADSYALLDAGETRKIEQVGPYRVVRQAAQAHWPVALKANAWREVAAVHHRSKQGGGHWEFKQKLPQTWSIDWGGIRFQVKLTDFGHIGLFPEQYQNWQWLRDCGQRYGEIKMLNLFAYTGGSSLAGAQGGMEVTHVDASKGVVSWARENQALNQLDEKPIRWLVDDVGKFVEREQRRGNHYQGVVLDPPTYGRGPKGQTWKIEEHLIPLLEQIKPLLQPLKFVLLSCHTPGYTGLTLCNVLHKVFGVPVSQMTEGEMTVPIGDSGLVLPSGTFARFAL
jgi:23S rRNA (cytosine1962-C5)-methyltransferase